MSEIEIMISLYKKELADKIEECNLFKAIVERRFERYTVLVHERETLLAFGDHVV